jgi:DNA-binding NtrC family response regulator
VAQLKKTASQITNKHKRIRVLHVDADSEFLKIFKLIMMEMDNQLDIDEVRSVKEAFAKLKRKKYDVVISDYDMIQKDGLQFLKELREAKNKIPFILFTIRSKEELPPNALNFEFTHYISKYGNAETVFKEMANTIVAYAEICT